MGTDLDKGALSLAPGDVVEPLSFRTKSLLCLFETPDGSAATTLVVTGVEVTESHRLIYELNGITNVRREEVALVSRATKESLASLSDSQYVNDEWKDEPPRNIDPDD